MTDKNKFSFKDFGKQLDEVVVPSGIVDSPEDQEIFDKEVIPNLFASIHWKGPDREFGYEPEDVEAMNLIANEHILGPAKHDDPKVQAAIDKIKSGHKDD
jgi:hypothetical protein